MTIPLTEAWPREVGVTATPLLPPVLTAGEALSAGLSEALNAPAENGFSAGGPPSVRCTPTVRTEGETPQGKEITDE